MLRQLLRLKSMSEWKECKYDDLVVVEISKTTSKKNQDFFN